MSDFFGYIGNFYIFGLKKIEFCFQEVIYFIILSITAHWCFGNGGDEYVQVVIQLISFFLYMCKIDIYKIVVFGTNPIEKSLYD